MANVTRRMGFGRRRTNSKTSSNCHLCDNDAIIEVRSAPTAYSFFSIMAIVVAVLAAAASFLQEPAEPVIETFI